MVFQVPILYRLNTKRGSNSPSYDYSVISTQIFISQIGLLFLLIMLF